MACATSRPGRQEGQVADALDAAGLASSTKRAQADADGGQEQDGAEEGGEERAPPGAPVDEQVVLDDAGDGARGGRDAHAGRLTRRGCGR